MKKFRLKNIICIILASVMMFAVCTFLASCGENLEGNRILNGDFYLRNENGSRIVDRSSNGFNIYKRWADENDPNIPYGWSLFRRHDTSTTYRLGYDEPTVRDADNYLEIDHGLVASYSYIMQKVRVKPHTDYAISLWYRTRGVNTQNPNLRFYFGQDPSRAVSAKYDDTGLNINSWKEYKVVVNTNTISELTLFIMFGGRNEDIFEVNSSNQITEGGSNLASTGATGVVHLRDIRVVESDVTTNTVLNFVSQNLFKNYDFIERDENGNRVSENGVFKVAKDENGYPIDWSFVSSDHNISAYSAHREISEGGFNARSNYMRIVHLDYAFSTAYQSIEVNKNSYYQITYSYYVSPNISFSSALSTQHANYGMHIGIRQDPMYILNGQRVTQIKTQNIDSYVSKSGTSRWTSSTAFTIGSGNNTKLDIGINFGIEGSPVKGEIWVTSFSIKEVARGSVGYVYEVENNQGYGQNQAGEIAFFIVMILLTLAGFAFFVFRFTNHNFGLKHCFMAAFGGKSEGENRSEVDGASGSANENNCDPEKGESLSVESEKTEDDDSKGESLSVESEKTEDDDSKGESLSVEGEKPEEISKNENESVGGQLYEFEADEDTHASNKLNAILLRIKSYAVTAYRASITHLMRFISSPYLSVFIIALIGFVLRLLLSTITRGNRDIVGALLSDINTLRSYDLDGYIMNGGTNHMPFKAFLLYLLGTFVSGSTINLSNSTALLIRLPSFIFDIATGILLYSAARKLNAKKQSAIPLLVLALYIFNPLTIINSVTMQLDTTFVFFTVLALYYLINKRHILMSLSYITAFMFDIKALVVLPAILAYVGIQLVQSVVYLTKNKNASLKDEKVQFPLITIAGCIVGFLVFYFAALPFTTIAYDGSMGDTINFYIIERINDFTIITHNGLNIYSLIGINGGSIENFPALLFTGLFLGLLTAFSVVIYYKFRNRISILMLSAYCVLAMSIIFVNTDQGFAFPSFALLLMCFAVIKDKRFFTYACVFALFNAINIYMVMTNANFLNNLPDYLLTHSINKLYDKSTLIPNGIPFILPIMSALVVCTFVFYVMTLFSVAFNQKLSPFKDRSSPSKFGESIADYILPPK